MSGQEAIVASISDALPPNLSFRPTPGASWCLDRRQTRWYVQGSDTYSPGSGVQVMRFRISAGPNEWLSPNSVRLQFDFTPKDGNMKPVANAQCLFSRLTIRANNALLEDVQNYHMSYSVFEKCLTRAAREREAGMAFPMTSLSADGEVEYEAMLQDKKYTVSVNLLSGLFLQPKWIWPHAMPLDISLEIQDGAKLFKEFTGATQLSTNYQISNAMILGDLHTVSIDITNAFTNHIENGNPLDYFVQSIDCVEHSVPDASLWSINQARAYSQLNMIMAVMCVAEEAATASTNGVKDVTHFVGPVI